MLRDPASPLAAARALSRAALKRDEAFAQGITAALPDAAVAPRESDLRRAYPERLAEPFAREVAFLAERPYFGPRERRDLDALFDRIESIDPTGLTGLPLSWLCGALRRARVQIP